MILEPGTHIERYEIQRLIGEGGMARVYLARHTTLGTLHALKILSRAGKGEFNERLMAEGRVQARLSHPNIVRVSDVLQIGDHPALVMEYVEGPSLHEWLYFNRPTPREAELLLRDLLDGVEAGHAAGVVHRDLKPANILLARLEPSEAGAPSAEDLREQIEGASLDDWVPKITDFGLVKVLTDQGGQGLTRENISMGTPQYMAPEQFRSAANVDHRADIFSLGAILYEVLAGQQAYGGTDIIDIFDRISEEERPPLPDEVPPHLAAVIEACCRPDLEDRPEDCAQVRALLEAAPGAPTEGEPAQSQLATFALPLGALALTLIPPLLILVSTVAVGLWWLWPEDPTEPLPTQIEAPAPDDEASAPDGEDPGTDEAEDDTEQDSAEEEVEEPAEATAGCPTDPSGEIIGYARPQPFPPPGPVWRLANHKTVYAAPPSAGTGWSVRGIPRVCTLRPGSTVKMLHKPIRIRGAGQWVPIVAGHFTAH